ncbi:MAG: SufE family protein [Pseudomonadota bacterium]
MSAPVEFEEIKETFDLLDDWEERYRYVIELGKGLPGLSEAERTPETKVDGCVSQVWLVPHVSQDADGTERLHFEGDSDAHIVRGLIAVLRGLLSGKPVAEIREADPLAEMAALGLDAHLSPQRSNGLRAMVKRIKSIASAAQSA